MGEKFGAKGFSWVCGFACFCFYLLVPGCGAFAPLAIGSAAGMTRPTGLRNMVIRDIKPPYAAQLWMKIAPSAPGGRLCRPKRIQEPRKPNAEGIKQAAGKVLVLIAIQFWTWTIFKSESWLGLDRLANPPAHAAVLSQAADLGDARSGIQVGGVAIKTPVITAPEISGYEDKFSKSSVVKQLIACGMLAFLVGIPASVLIVGGVSFGSWVGAVGVLGGLILTALRLRPRVSKLRFQMSDFLNSDFFKVFDFWKLLDGLRQPEGTSANMEAMTAEKEKALPSVDPVWKKVNQELWASQEAVKTLQAENEALRNQVLKLENLLAEVRAESNDGGSRGKNDRIL